MLNVSPRLQKKLQQARLQIEEDAFSHLDEANKEITLIIEDLDQLLRATESALIGDILLERIREIIKTESSSVVKLPSGANYCSSTQMQQQLTNLA